MAAWQEVWVAPAAAADRMSGIFITPPTPRPAHQPYRRDDI